MSEDTGFRNANKRRERFTMLSNAMLRDNRLSLKAKGLLGLMLSFPDDWQYYMEQLETYSTDGRDAHRSAARELITLGYVQRHQTRDEKGLLAPYSYAVSDEIEDRPEIVSPSANGKSGAGLSGAGKTPTTNTDHTKTDNTKSKDSAPDGAEASPAPEIAEEQAKPTESHSDAQTSQKTPGGEASASKAEPSSSSAAKVPAKKDATDLGEAGQPSTDKFVGSEKGAPRSRKSDIPATPRVLGEHAKLVGALSVILYQSTTPKPDCASQVGKHAKSLLAMDPPILAEEATQLHSQIDAFTAKNVNIKNISDKIAEQRGKKRKLTTTDINEDSLRKAAELRAKNPVVKYKTFDEMVAAKRAEREANQGAPS